MTGFSHCVRMKQLPPSVHWRYARHTQRATSCSVQSATSCSVQSAETFSAADSANTYWWSLCVEEIHILIIRCFAVDLINPSQGTHDTLVWWFLVTKNIFFRRDRHTTGLFMINSGWIIMLCQKSAAWNCKHCTLYGNITNICEENMCL